MIVNNFSDEPVSEIVKEEMPKTGMYFVWVSGRTGPIPQLWNTEIMTNEGKPVPTLFKNELEYLETTDLKELIEKYPLDKVTAAAEPPKSKVTLIDCTGMNTGDKDYAINRLLFTKNTRLEMKPDTLNDIMRWPEEKKMQELEYMANTIPSSWEFVDYTFLITGVSRAFTHQFVRSRHCSFAQQTMRVLDVTGWDYATGPSIAESSNNSKIYKGVMSQIAAGYNALTRNGAKIEDARGVLPTNILTNIVMKCNMRTFVELVRKRSSSRTQGEYRIVLEQMKSAVREEHPWIDLFINRTFDQAINDLEALINQDPSREMKTAMIKLLDQIRSSQ